MDLQNTTESLNTQELELLNDFQMEELEQRFEMEEEAAAGWLKILSTPQPSSTPTTIG